jgi:hypothetical protein
MSFFLHSFRLIFSGSNIQSVLYSLLTHSHPLPLSHTLTHTLLFTHVTHPSQSLSFTPAYLHTLHNATSRKVERSSPDEVDFFFKLPNPFSRTMALRSTQPLTEMSTRNLPGGKGRPARRSDKLTDICEPIV